MTDQLSLGGNGGGGRRPARPSILGLDLSLTATGYCLNGESGRITSREKGWDRVAEIVQEVTRLTFGVDVVVVEGPAYGAKDQRGIWERAGLRGALFLWLYQHHLTTVEVTPATLKMYATGRGNAHKDAMIAAAIRRFYFQGSDNNEADAYLLWCMGREAYGGPVAKVPADRAAHVHRLEWPRFIHREIA
jgi:crossover junction endodeoxyribonuclease RuvC